MSKKRLIKFLITEYNPEKLIDLNNRDSSYIFLELSKKKKSKIKTQYLKDLISK